MNTTTTASAATSHDAGARRSLRALQTCTLSEATDLAEQQLRLRNQYPELRGPRTGLGSLDEQTRFTFEPGRLTVVGATSGGGKSALLAQFAVEMAAQVPVLYLSLEDEPADIVQRMIALTSSHDVGKVRSGFADVRPKAGLPTDALEAMELLRRRNITVNSLAQQADIVAIAMAAHRWHRQLDSAPGVIVVDQLSHIENTDERDWPEDFTTLERPNRFRPRHEQWEWKANVLRQIGGQLGCTTILAAQLNRERDRDGRPTLDSIRGSSGIAHKADTVMLLHRPDTVPDPLAGPGQPNRRPNVEGRVNLLVAKARRGPTFDTELTFDGARQRFRDVNIPADRPWRSQPSPTETESEGRRRLAAFLSQRKVSSRPPLVAVN